MSTETYNKTSENSESKSYKCNIEVLKKRLLLEKKREIFQSRIILATFCISLGVIGYFVI